MSTTFRRGAGALVAGLLVAGGGATAQADSHNANHAGYWEQVLMDPDGAYADHGFTNVQCTKVADDYSGESWTADRDYLAVILNAGSEQSTENPDDVELNVAAGTTLYHDSTKEISHVIACTGDVPEEPTKPAEPEPTKPAEPEPTKPAEPTHPAKPTVPGTPGGPGDDAGKPVGPVVQTDVPEQGVNPVLPLAAIAAAGLGLAGLGLRRRGQEH